MENMSQSNPGIPSVSMQYHYIEQYSFSQRHLEWFAHAPNGLKFFLLKYTA